MNGHRNAMVVLSGGFDSAALLHWVLEPLRAKVIERDVRCVSFDYGQPHRDAELAAAQAIAEGQGMTSTNGRWERIRITDLGPLDVKPGYSKPAVARAFVPMRNLVFIAYAANRAARTWPGQDSIVLYGANADDAAGFADCRRGFVVQASATVQQAMSGSSSILVSAPWVDQSMRKEDILAWAAKHDHILADLRRSVSCYLGTRCGKCDSCTRRAQAFERAGIQDGTGLPASMVGGDPQRVRKLPTVPA